LEMLLLWQKTKQTKPHSGFYFTLDDKQKGHTA